MGYLDFPSEFWRTQRKQNSSSKNDKKLSLLNRKKGRKPKTRKWITLHRDNSYSLNMTNSSFWIPVRQDWIPSELKMALPAVWGSVDGFHVHFPWSLVTNWVWADKQKLDLARRINVINNPAKLYIHQAKSFGFETFSIMRHYKISLNYYTKRSTVLGDGGSDQRKTTIWKLTSLYKGS